MEVPSAATPDTMEAPIAAEPIAADEIFSLDADEVPVISGNAGGGGTDPSGRDPGRSRPSGRDPLAEAIPAEEIISLDSDAIVAEPH